MKLISLKCDCHVHLLITYLYHKRWEIYDHFSSSPSL